MARIGAYHGYATHIRDVTSPPAIEKVDVLAAKLPN